MSGNHMYKYKVATGRFVTQEVWDAMTANEKLNQFKRVNKLSTDADIAAFLGVHSITVSRWRQGTRTISDKPMRAMEAACIEGNDLPMREFVAVNTVAVDPALDVFDRAFSGDNYIALNVSCYVLALKIAVASEKLLPFEVVPTLSTCCGVTPAYVALNLLVPGTDFKADIKVTYVTAPAREYVARVNFAVGDKINARFGYTMSDRAVVEILDKTKNYVLKHVRRKTAK